MDSATITIHKAVRTIHTHNSSCRNRVPINLVKFFGHGCHSKGGGKKEAWQIKRVFKNDLFTTINAVCRFLGMNNIIKELGGGGV